MPFQPLNEDHAIQSAGFLISLSQPLPRPTIERIRLEPQPWRSDLPAIEPAQLAEVQINPATSLPRAVITQGVDFSFKRPDGSASWSLRFMAADIVAETALYTRWEQTWGKAKGLLCSAIQRTVEIEPETDRTIVNCVQNVTDIFVSDDAAPQFDEVFSRSASLPARVFELGNAWHAYTGWFTPAEGARILHNVNITSVGGKRLETGSTSERDVVTVTVVHQQTYRPVEPLKLKPFDRAGVEAWLDLAYERMHELNKAELAKLLDPRMRERIGLK